MREQVSGGLWKEEGRLEKGQEWGLSWVLLRWKFEQRPSRVMLEDQRLPGMNYDGATHANGEFGQIFP